MLQLIRIRFTALSCFETIICLCVFLRGLLRTHANKAVTDRQTKFVNKPFITDLSVRPIAGFHMTSLKFKLKNYRSYRDFTFTMH